MRDAQKLVNLYQEQQLVTTGMHFMGLTMTNCAGRIAAVEDVVLTTYDCLAISAFHYIDAGHDFWEKHQDMTKCRTHCVKWLNKQMKIHGGMTGLLNALRDGDL